MTRRATFVVNRGAGRGRFGARWAEMEPRVRAAFPDAEVQFTRGRGDGARIAAEAAARGQDLLVAVGGDGTLHEVANGMLAAGAGAGAVLGCLPCGSGSDFARGQGVPDDPVAALEVLRDAEPRALDVGRIACRALEGKDDDADEAQVTRHFVNVASIGLGAQVVARMEKRARGVPGRPTYLWSTVRALVRWRNPEVELRADDGAPERVRIKAVAVANGAYFGGGMCVAPDARVDDGTLDLVVFGDLGRIEALRRLGETFQGRRIEHPRIRYGRCRALEARAEREVLLEADGELLGRLPARIAIRPKALRAVLPPGPPSAAARADQAAQT